MYHEITNENAYQTPMRIYPAVHYTMGGLWVDYNLMSNLPGLFVLGEANFSDHGANRLGASALMQGLADGYFVLPATISGYLATQKPDKRPATDHAAFKQAEENVQRHHEALAEQQGQAHAGSFHKELGKMMWEHCGMARNKAGLEKGIKLIRALREEYLEERQCARRSRRVEPVAGTRRARRRLHRTGRIAVPRRADREESCGGHFREEYQYTQDDPEVQQGLVNAGDVKRRDDHSPTWPPGNMPATGKAPVLNKEPLVYEEVKMSTRSYK